jgi:hypothetical protein
VALLALGASDCEIVRDGLLGQPANGLSSLAYVVAGAYVLRRDAPVALGLALVAVGAGSVMYHGPMPSGAEAVHDGSIAVLAATAAAVAWRRRSLPRPPVLAVAALASGIAVNLLTRTGAPLCRPGSLAQGHAAWHVLTAVAAAHWIASWRPATRRGGAARDPAALPEVRPGPPAGGGQRRLPASQPSGST